MGVPWDRLSQDALKIHAKDTTLSYTPSDCCMQLCLQQPHLELGRPRLSPFTFLLSPFAFPLSSYPTLGGRWQYCFAWLWTGEIILISDKGNLDEGVKNFSYLTSLVMGTTVGWDVDHAEARSQANSRVRLHLFQARQARYGPPSANLHT